MSDYETVLDEMLTALKRAEQTNPRELYGDDFNVPMITGCGKAYGHPTCTCCGGQYYWFDKLGGGKVPVNIGDTPLGHMYKRCVGVIDSYMDTCHWRFSWYGHACRPVYDMALAFCKYRSYFGSDGQRLQTAQMPSYDKIVDIQILQMQRYPEEVRTLIVHDILTHEQ